MKKIFMFSIMLLGVLVFNNNVKAACGAGVTLGEERLCMAMPCSAGECEYTSQSNESGTAYTKRLEDGRIILVLNNYNGGTISFWSGLGNPLMGDEIELIGDNYITNENSYGILSFVTGVNFAGEGTLTIKSKMPFVSTDADRQEAQYSLDNNKVSTIKIVTNEVETNIEESKPTDNDENAEIKDETNNENEEVKVEENNNLIVIALVVSLCVSVLCLIAVIAFVVKNNKSKKENN